jgi:anaerobic selenocysteine-containing dehydrogenase
MIAGLENKSGLTYEQAIALANQSGEKVVPTFCAMCGPTPMCCGIYAFSKDNCLTKVAGMREFPANKGGLCPKGQAAPQWVHSPDRLKYPLRRIGPKGEGRFEKITWDEAIDIIAATLKQQKEQYGPESLAILAPAMRTYNAYDNKRFECIVVYYGIFDQKVLLECGTAARSTLL